jgi:hypothetical protein
LRNSFGTLLRSLAARYPKTPLLVLSGLAAGADVLAAEEAFAQDIPVLACLPMPIDEYEKDFSASELSRFHAAIARCARVTVVSTSADRNAGYVATELFLSHYSNVLVAFWDGADARGQGGTAEVVHTRITGEAASLGGVADIPYLPDVGPVYHIVTPRAGQAPPPDAYGAHWRYPERFDEDTLVERDYHAALERLDTFNADLASHRDSPHAANTLERLRDHTDEVANALQKRTSLFLGLLYVCAFLAAFLQITTRSELEKIGGLAVAFAFYLLARRNNYENRYQDYRALAEGLRVQSAWYCAGLWRKLVDLCYLRMQQSDLQWIRMALRCAYLLFCEERPCPGASPDHPLCREWVEGQWAYFKRAAEREAHQHARLTKISMVFLVIGGALLLGATAALSLAHFAPASEISLWVQAHAAPLEDLQSVPMAMAAMTAALLAQYSEKRAYSANAKRYQRMFLVFDRARKQLHKIGPERTADAQTIVHDLGQEALVEHAEWLLASRDRPMSVVHV